MHYINQMGWLKPIIFIMYLVIAPYFIAAIICVISILIISKIFNFRITKTSRLQLAKRHKREEAINSLTIWRSDSNGNVW